MPAPQRDDFDSIDENQLDQECYAHPSLVRKYSELTADARHEYMIAEQMLEYTEASVRLDVRRNPDQYGLEEQPKVDDVKAAVIADQRYQEAQTAVNKAKHDLDYLQAAVNTLEHRRKMLEKAVDLTLINYRTEREPRAGRTNINVREEARERARQSVSQPVQPRRRG